MSVSFLLSFIYITNNVPQKNSKVTAIVMVYLFYNNILINFEVNNQPVLDKHHKIINYDLYFYNPRQATIKEERNF